MDRAWIAWDRGGSPWIAWIAWIAASLKAAVIPVVLHYSTADPLS